MSLAEELKLEERALWHDERRKARTDLYWLLTEVCGRKDMTHPWLYDRCREVQAKPDGHLDLWSREHYKSTIITFGLTLFDILRSHGDGAVVDREACVGIFSHTRPIAKAFLRQLKREFEGNERLRALFPDIIWANPQAEAPKWSEDDGIILKRKGNPKEATVEAWGLVDGQPTSKHFTHLIYDDVVVPASVTTPDMMQKTSDAISLSFNLGAHGGVRRFIGTRYHFNDAYKTIMDRKTALPRIHPATVDGTPDGEPVLITREALAEKRRDQGPYIFAAQMLLNPKADETQGFMREWTEVRHKGVSHKAMNVYLLFDPASSKKKTSDYTAAWAVGLNADGNIYIIDMVRDRFNLVERTRLLFEWHEKYKPIQTRYEKYGKDGDIEHIKAEMDRRVYRFEITEVGGKTSKEDRIKRLIPYFEQGKIILPRFLYYTDYEGQTRDLVADFIEQEYMGFPVGVHDDMLDSLARLFEPELTLIWPKERSKIKKALRTKAGSGYDSWVDF